MAAARVRGRARPRDAVSDEAIVAAGVDAALMGCAPLWRACTRTPAPSVRSDRQPSGEGPVYVRWAVRRATRGADQPRRRVGQGRSAFGVVGNAVRARAGPTRSQPSRTTPARCCGPRSPARTRRSSSSTRRCTQCAGQFCTIVLAPRLADGPRHLTPVGPPSFSFALSSRSKTTLKTDRAAHASDLALARDAIWL